MSRFHLPIQIQRAAIVLSISLTPAIAQATTDGNVTTAEKREISVPENIDQVERWNRFADALYKLHEQNLRGVEYSTRENIKRYGGLLAKGREYRHVRYYDKESGRLLSRIEWKPGSTSRIFVIEVFEYDDKGRLERDYAAAYLPVYHNAPFQTLINVHYQDKSVRAYRQFDASGRRIYEQCKGTMNGGDFSLSLEDYELPRYEYEQDQIKPAGAYWSCFSFLPTRIDAEIDRLLALVPEDAGNGSAPADAATTDQVRAEIMRLTRLIEQDPDNAGLYLQRGQAHRALLDFESAIADLDRAIQLNDALDMAYFERGMALGRAGRVRAGIDDLTKYIERNPASSLAYTKRGVRYLWIGDEDNAMRDLENALLLDPQNAEAHDDLGVIHARAGDYAKAEQHFGNTIRLEPSYEKAYHNLATVYYLTGRAAMALNMIDMALEMQPESRESLVLKSEILSTLGREEEAQALKDEAEYLPSINWTERLSVQ